MAIGRHSEFFEAWRDLREQFMRRLAREHLGVEISNMGIRRFDFSKPLVDVFNEIKKSHFFVSTIHRAGRRIRVIIRRRT